MALEDILGVQESRLYGWYFCQVVFASGQIPVDALSGPRLAVSTSAQVLLLRYLCSGAFAHIFLSCYLQYLCSR